MSETARARSDRPKTSEATVVSRRGLVTFVSDILEAVGTPSEAANMVAACLVAADTEGVASHGVMLLPMYIERIRNGSVSPANDGRVISDRGGAVVLDADAGLGPVTARKAAALAIERARAHNIAVVAVRNGFHLGMLAPWARMIAESNCIGFVASNTRPLMPAPGGAEPVVGNNPIAVAAPTLNSHPIVIDLALSAGAMGKVRLAAATGQTIPEGWATDRNGEPTTDPEEAIAGMLLPAAGAKGFGLALMVELLSGGLSGGAMGAGVKPLYGDPSQPYNCSHFFMAISIAAFRPPDDFKRDVAALARAIRSSRPAPEMPEPRVPGDRAAAAMAHNAECCEISGATLAALQATGGSVGVTFPQQMVLHDA